MTELVEYTLVVLVSALFVGGSVATYGKYASFASGLELRVDSASVVKLADQAVSAGSSAMALTLPPSTISCQDGLLNMTAKGASQLQAVTAGCDFHVELTGGEHTLRFSYSGSQLSLAAT